MSTMKFCRECNNILYPKEDRDQKILLYACRNCDHQGISEIFLAQLNVNFVGLGGAIQSVGLFVNKLIYQHLGKEVADNNCVYRNEITHDAGERTQVLQDVAADPTLPRTKTVRCAMCSHPEAVFFQATARGEEGMALFFVCCNPSCGHRWRD